MRKGIGQPVQHWPDIKHNIEMNLSLPSFLYCVLYVVNVEPVDISLPSFLVLYVWSILNRLTYPFPNFYIVFYVCSIHIKQNIEMRKGIGQPVQHWPDIKHNIEMREGIGQPVQHWSHIKHKKCGKW
jgi:hypothetical protein